MEKEKQVEALQKALYDNIVFESDAPDSDVDYKWTARKLVEAGFGKVFAMPART